ncbi:MAG: opine dehydrogenase [Clostridium sp.]|jgi:opine dehydrogenase
MNNKLEGKNYKWVLIGAGNGGQSMAGHLGVMGFSVKIFDVFKPVIDAIKEQGGIHVDGVVNGFGKVELATTDIKEALEDVDVIVVTLPSLYHASIAKACAPYLKDGQIVLLHPTATFGSLEFRKVLIDEKCKANIILADTQTLLYTCRSPKFGYANIFGIKNVVLTAALPSKYNEKVLSIINTAFPQFIAAENVLRTGLENLNAMMHPAPTILNTGRIDSQEDFLYYLDGITPAVGHYVEEMDKERIEIGKAVGLKLTPMTEWYRKMYDAKGDTLSELAKSTECYKGVKGQKSLKTRYLLEDVPNSLEPIVSLGHMLGVNVSKMETIVNLVRDMLGDEVVPGRTMARLGLEGMNVEQLNKLVNEVVA